MDKHEIVLKFLDKRFDQEEKRRQIDYDRRNEMVALENLLPSSSKQYHILTLNEVIRHEEAQYKQLTVDLEELVSKLKPILSEENATYTNPFEVHIEGESYAMVWLDDFGKIQGIRRISKI